LCGPANPAYRRKFEAALQEVGPASEKITYLGEVPNSELPKLYADSDLLLFASSCENLPNILIEAMACGIPICCSDRSPMPEIARDACLYFDPADPNSIAGAVRSALTDWQGTQARARLGLAYAEDYSWATTTRRTFGFLADVAGAH
jgi:glycosyltransferase involved in cell wall biosynthesis